MRGMQEDILLCDAIAGLESKLGEEDRIILGRIFKSVVGIVGVMATGQKNINLLGVLLGSTLQCISERGLLLADNALSISKMMEGIKGVDVQEVMDIFMQEGRY